MIAPATKQPGWVYILTNPAMPGLVKVGLTTRTPTQRANELTGATGVPASFIVAWSRAVSDCAAVESIVHRMLDDRRVTGRREFFRCDVQTARQVIEAAAAGKLGRRYRPPAPARRWRGRRKDATGLVLLMASAALVAVLVMFKPALPHWLPGPVRESLSAIEQIAP